MRFVLLISLCIFTGSGNAQTFLARIDHDTTTSKGVTIRFCISLDSFYGDTLLKLEAPGGYVIKSNGSSDRVLLALQTKKGYAVIDACPGNEYAWNYSFSRFDFNGEGHEELIISWSGGMGRSGFMDGWNETTGGIYLWDIDNAELIFDIQDHYEYNYWWTGAEFDSTGHYMTDSLGNVIFNDSNAGGESSCENYDVEIACKIITVVPSADCKLVYPDSEEPAPETEKTRVYRWTKDGLSEQD